MARKRRERTPEELARAQKSHWHRKLILGALLLVAAVVVWLISFGPRAV